MLSSKINSNVRILNVCVRIHASGLHACTHAESSTTAVVYTCICLLMHARISACVCAYVQARKQIKLAASQQTVAQVLRLMIHMYFFSIHSMQQQCHRESL